MRALTSSAPTLEGSTFTSRSRSQRHALFLSHPSVAPPPLWRPLLLRLPLPSTLYFAYCIDNVFSHPCSLPRCTPPPLFTSPSLAAGGLLLIILVLLSVHVLFPEDASARW